MFEFHVVFALAGTAPQEAPPGEQRLHNVAARGQLLQGPLLWTAAGTMLPRKATPLLSVPRHNQAYVNGFNSAIEQYAEAEHKEDVGKMISLQQALKFNGGGARGRCGGWLLMLAGGCEQTLTSAAIRA
jgi:hypothetical protein